MSLPDTIRALSTIGVRSPVESGSLDRITEKLPEGNASFADVLKGFVSDVSLMQDQSQSAIDSFVRGEPVELHQVMAAAEEANITLEFLVELRNKFVDAYRSLINMQ